MDQKPKLTISGFRGIWGKDLTDQVAYEYGRAFAKLIGKGKIIIGQDGRKSGKTIFVALKTAFEREGIEVEDAGIIPTPSILLLIKKLGLSGGMIITGSHNNIEYNGLKFVMGNALFTLGNEISRIEEIKNNLSESEKIYSPKDVSMTKDNKKFRQIHIDEILKNVDVYLIKSKKYKVALDPINSSGAVITKELLEELSCETYLINEEQNGEFNHPPEPRIENVGGISEVVLRNKCDIGFVQDPDADRLLLITEKGEVLSEEYTLALSAKNVLSQTPGNMAVNMSTSNLNKYITDKNKSILHHSAVGELNVVSLMRATQSVVGGEGNGGVIYPKINEARDSLVGIALVLELMARENKKISEIVAEFPKYIMRKEKINFNGNLWNEYTKLKVVFGRSKVDESDGIRFDFEDGSWIHIRPSNTEPVVRIIGESTDQKTLEALFSEAKLTLGLN